MSSVDVQVLTPRDVPLGGLRAMRVRRTLPQRERSLVGAWCFADHYGPDPVAETGGMVVPPHPHTGLQTVSWLFAGEVEHRAEEQGGEAPHEQAAGLEAGSAVARRVDDGGRRLPARPAVVADGVHRTDR